MVELAAFRIQTALKPEKREPPPFLAAVKRSPTAGLRRRDMRAMCDKVSRAFPMLDLEVSGVVYSAGREAAGYNLHEKKWERKEGSISTAVSWERFISEMEK